MVTLWGDLRQLRFRIVDDATMKWMQSLSPQSVQSSSPRAPEAERSGLPFVAQGQFLLGQVKL
ncbi:MAG: hypothetical protein RL322_1098 [Pseudomonadota bacterium]|jgi:hypothetical protein